MARPDIASRLIVTALFLSIGISVSAFLTKQDDIGFRTFSWQRMDEIAAATSPFVFLCACVLVLWRPRFGYGAGLLGSLLALPLFVRIELSLAPWNSWIFLDQDGSAYFQGPVPTFAKLRILSPALIVIAVTVCLLRLLPARWSLRGVPLRQRTWPALALAFCVLAVWFVESVTPYSVAAFDHSPNLEFRILHVLKRGLRFQETTIAEYRGQVWILRHDRRLFQYRFVDHAFLLNLGEQSPTTFDRVRTFVQSPTLWKLHTPPAKALWSWNGEGWYVVLKDSRLLAFTSENGIAAPEEATTLFHEIETLPASETRQFEVRDVCLGFSYDPVAALGFSVLRQRTRLLNLNNSAAGAGF